VFNDQFLIEPEDDDGGEPYPEQCDDGNRDDSDACVARCRSALR
jgi:cysteine-rich repeat protein